MILSQRFVLNRRFTLTAAAALFRANKVPYTLLFVFDEDFQPESFFISDSMLEGT